MVLLNLLLSRYHVVEHYHCHEWWSYSYCDNSPFISSKTQKWTNETRPNISNVNLKAWICQIGFYIYDSTNQGLFHL